MHLARTTRRLALLAALGGAALSAMTGSALADSTCSYDASFHRVNVYDGSGATTALRIGRIGQYIVVRDGVSGPTSYCSSYNGVATVTNTDKVIVDGNAGFGDGFVIDESSGELAPGWSPEADSHSEIEVLFRNVTQPGTNYGTFPRLDVVGSSQADWIRFSGSNGVLIGDDNDIDVSVVKKTDTTAMQSDMVAWGGAGADVLSARGTYPYNSEQPPAATSVTLHGGDGNDIMRGYSSTKLYGDGDDDSFYNVPGSYNYVSGGFGSDWAEVNKTDTVTANTEQVIVR